MLEITIPGGEFYDEETETFLEADGHTLRLEHSLVSLSKWEEKWEKPFLTNLSKTVEESLDYVRCMSLDDIPEGVLQNIDDSIMKQIFDYMERPMTATTIGDRHKGRGSREVVTAELIYYWMVALGIDFQCQYWHLNRLLTLVTVCNIKNQPGKKLSKAAVAKRNRNLNAARKAKYNTRG
jgi:hypothetical protein